MTIKKYVVLSPVKTADGTVFDGTVDIDDRDVAELRASGVIGEEYVAGQMLTDDQKLDAVKQAILMLNVDNGELWLKDGKPNAASVTEIVGFNVSASLRDQAWDAVKTNAQADVVNTPTAEAQANTTGISATNPATLESLANTTDTTAAEAAPADAAYVPLVIAGGESQV